MKIDLSDNEVNLLRNLLDKIQVKPTAPDAMPIVTTVQSLWSKLSDPPQPSQSQSSLAKLMTEQDDVA